jgi:hypothetical protein
MSLMGSMMIAPEEEEVSHGYQHRTYKKACRFLNFINNSAMKPNVRRLLSGNAGPTDSSARDVVMGCVRW